MCTGVISSLNKKTVMAMSSNSLAETCDTLLLLVIPVCCHFIYNLYLFQAYKIEVRRRSLSAILVDPVGFRKMTSYSLLLYLLQGLPPNLISPEYIISSCHLVFHFRMFCMRQRPIKGLLKRSDFIMLTMFLVILATLSKSVMWFTLSNDRVKSKNIVPVIF